MTEPLSKRSATADAVEALVRAIEAKESLGREPDVEEPVEPTQPHEAAVERRPPAIVNEPSPAAPIRHRPTATGWAWSSTRRGPLPGLVDRQLWEALVAEEAERQHRYERPAVVVLVELVGLKTMVERLGPAAMNRLVPPCAELLVSLARSTDRITRLTNSRFGVLLLETDAGGGARFAARITVAAEPRIAGNPWSVRMVVGWAGAATGAELRQAISAADAHLRSRIGSNEPDGVARAAGGGLGARRTWSTTPSGPRRPTPG